MTFDANGNTTTDEKGKTLVYDAWNRLVEYKNGGTSLIRYAYDGVNRRVAEGSRALYYSSQWQVLEERVSDVVKSQQLWSPVYVDALIERDASSSDSAADGTLDTGFDGDGKLVDNINTGASGEDADGVVVQPDGKIVVAGRQNGQFMIVRYNVDGSRDTSFGTGGDGVVRNVVFTNGSGANAVVLQSDGKIVVAGIAGGTVNPMLAVARLNADGTLDTSFNTTGKRTIDFASGTGTEGADGVVIQPDGRIVLAGYAGGDFATVRLNADGSLDTSFSGDGKDTQDMGSASDFGLAIALQSDGKIVVAGQTTVDFAVLRYNADGTLDTSFDTDGKKLIDYTGSNTTTDKAKGVAVDASGRIVLGGSSGNDFMVARLNSDGSLDTSFDGDGKALADVGATDVGRSLILESDGKIIVAGDAGGDFGLARFNPDGSLDTSFDGDGKMSVNLGGTEKNFEVVQQADGKLVAVGVSGSDTGVIRVHGTGRLYVTQDANFNVTGVVQPGNGLIQAAGTVVERYVYGAYGEQTILTASWAVDSDGITGVNFNRYGHQTGRIDLVTGLIHFRYRDYSPVLGRWTRMDPAGYVDGANAFESYKSGPTTKLDPSGLATAAECLLNYLTIQRRMLELIDDLRRYDPVSDGQGGPNWQPGGHYTEILERISGLRQDVARYIKECIQRPPTDGGNAKPCPKYWKKTTDQTVPPPVYPRRYELAPDSWQDEVRTIDDGLRDIAIGIGSVAKKGMEIFPPLPIPGGRPVRR